MKKTKKKKLYFKGVDLSKYEPGFPDDVNKVRDMLHELAHMKHDYNTTVDAATVAAQLAYRYISSVQGMTGFQASCAQMSFLRKERHLEHGFSIVDHSNVFYPQYDHRHEEVYEVSREGLEHVKKEAEARLKKCGDVHPEVKRRWQELAAGRLPHPYHLKVEESADVGT